MSTPTWKNPIIKWVDHRMPVFTFLDHSIITYPTPRNLNYWGNFGSLAGMVLVIMIVSGIGLGAVLPPRDLMVRALTPPGETGKVFGFVFVGYSVGISAVSVLFGWLLDGGMPEMVFTLSAVFAILALLTITAAHALTPRGD